MNRGPALGVIADDFTGATDVAGMLTQAGWNTLLTLGVPQAPLPVAEAVVVALKTRTVPAAQAVAESLAALEALRGAGAPRLYFKVCSTFDSTPAGNIGPVAEALMDALGAPFAIVCPAFPENGRSVYRGHLFVGDQLLSDSGMKDHPLTPMTDANLVRVLQAQVRRKVGLLRHATVAAGAAAVRDAMGVLRADAVGLAIADAVCDADLRVLAEATADAPLVVAGSGLALGLKAPDVSRIRASAATRAPIGAAARRTEAATAPRPQAATAPRPEGPAAVLAGSCSRATNTQVAHWRAAGRAALRLDPLALAGGEATVGEALQWAGERLSSQPVLLYASAEPAELKAVQAALGGAQAGALVERAMAALARGLVDRGVRRLVVAGGETSGAVAGALGIAVLQIGSSICPGVPWTQAVGRPLWLALKSGNFGGPAFFEEALGL